MSHSIRTLFTAASLLLGGAALSAPTPDTPVFLEGMRELEGELTRLHGALLRGDYAGIEQAANAIADSPDPPLPERQRLMHWAGDQVGAVSAEHGRMRETARELAGAAAADNQDDTLRHQQRLMQTCLDCHSIFRDRP